MVYKNFRISIFLQVAIIVILALALAFVMIRGNKLFIPIALAVALVAAVINLIRYIEKSNKDLTHFLLSIRQGAFTESYTSGNRGKQFEQLSDALNDVVKEFAKLNAEKELHYQYLQALNENINVAILSFDTEGKLMMMNPAAKKLLNRPTFMNISHFKNVDTKLFEAVTQIRPGERRVVQVFIGENHYYLSIQIKEIVLLQKKLSIVLLQNLNNELEDKEIEAWHQLMRVLTHEIMNSVTPIVSLTGAINSIVANPDGSPKDLSTLSEENIDDMFSSLSTITSRSMGLLRFVNAYKSYSKNLDLHAESAEIISVVMRIVNLLRPDLEASAIKVEVNAAQDQVKIKCDVALIEQVLINLIKNAIDATAKDGTGIIAIDIKTKTEGSVNISVSDNGIGMDDETMTKIFIPFFTTKKKGSGIGLSLSRQIMKLHNGNIRVQSSPLNGSTFTLELP